jgi:hypothetical protein
VSGLARTGWPSTYVSISSPETLLPIMNIMSSSNYLGELGTSLLI